MRAFLLDGFGAFVARARRKTREISARRTDRDGANFAGTLLAMAEEKVLIFGKDT
jgi:hypothetical protein